MIEHIQRYTFPAAFSLLPGVMDSPHARAMLLAIGLQESRFLHRRQVGGPARGFWQFERGGGVVGVLNHHATRDHLGKALREMRYGDTFATPAAHVELYEVIEHNDVIACVCARLLLWTVPGRLPEPNDPEGGWRQYLSGWRPGKPHRGTWDAFYRDAWERVKTANSGT